MSKLKQCPSCQKEVAKSAKICPNCGQKLKKGLCFKILIALIVAIILAMIFAPSEADKAKERERVINELRIAQPASLSASGELADIFGLMSNYTDLQRENKEKEIKGSIVEWRLPVFEVKKTDNGYKIQTSSRGNIIGTFVEVIPTSPEEVSYIENLKTNDVIQVKGVISGVFMRNIEISPAILSY